MITRERFEEDKRIVNCWKEGPNRYCEGRRCMYHFVSPELFDGKCLLKLSYREFLAALGYSAIDPDFKDIIEETNRRLNNGN